MYRIRRFEIFDFKERGRGTPSNNKTKFNGYEKQSNKKYQRSPYTITKATDSKQSINK